MILISLLAIFGGILIVLICCLCIYCYKESYEAKLEREIKQYGVQQQPVFQFEVVKGAPEKLPSVEVE